MFQDSNFPDKKREKESFSRFFKFQKSKYSDIRKEKSKASQSKINEESWREKAFGRPRNIWTYCRNSILSPGEGTWQRPQEGLRNPFAKQACALLSVRTCRRSKSLEWKCPPGASRWTDRSKTSVLYFFSPLPDVDTPEQFLRV